jgi:hypothetical protein
MHLTSRYIPMLFIGFADIWTGETVSCRSHVRSHDLVIEEVDRLLTSPMALQHRGRPNICEYSALPQTRS